MHEQTIGAWLEDLSSKAPTPGGGSAAALNAATGAALVSMVCNLTIGKPKYAQHEQTMQDVLAKATQLRQDALQLAEDDTAAFSTVMAAYGLPKDTAEEKVSRGAAIQDALVAAAEVPLRIASTAADVISLAARILDCSNANVVSDVAVAADSARAALSSAAINVEINLASMKDMAQRDTLTAQLAGYRDAEFTAGAIVSSVAERIAG